MYIYLLRSSYCNNVRFFCKIIKSANTTVYIYIYIHYCLDGHSGNDDWNFVIFEQCETHE